MSSAATYDNLFAINTPELCPDCGREWPRKFGSHNCNYHRAYVHNAALIVEPGADLFSTVDRIADRYESELCRSAQSADLAGEEPPYQAALADIDRTIGFLKHYRAEIQRLAGHTHRWNGDDYCSICGADGRA